MRDLYFTLATYSACVSKDKVHETLDTDEFIVNVYGEPVNPRKPSIDFNRCRCQFAELRCTYIDFKASEFGFKSSSQIDSVINELGTDKNILFINAYTASEYYLKDLFNLLDSLNTLIPMWLIKLGKEVDCNVFISFSPEDYSSIERNKKLLDPALVLKDDLCAVLV